MRLVILESPFAADTIEGIEENVRYARDCIHDCLKRDEAPIASHLLFPQMLDDKVPAQRALGTKAGLAWVSKADAMVVYLDRGMSNGMQAAVRYGISRNVKIEYRFLHGDKAAKPELYLVKEEPCSPMNT